MSVDAMNQIDKQTERVLFWERSPLSLVSIVLVRAHDARVFVLPMDSCLYEVFDCCELGRSCRYQKVSGISHGFWQHWFRYRRVEPPNEIVAGADCRAPPAMFRVEHYTGFDDSCLQIAALFKNELFGFFL